MAIKLTVGSYAEIVSAYIDTDGDYMVGELNVRVVANGFDNIQHFNFPDSYGYFIQGMSRREVEKQQDAIYKEMCNYLVEVYDFDPLTLKNMFYPKLRITN